MNQPGGILGQPAAGAVVAAPAGAGGSAQTGTAIDLMSPAEAATLLGVTENDVLAALTDGSLKAKKIGSTYRISRQAIDDFLKS